MKIKNENRPYKKEFGYYIGTTSIKGCDWEENKDDWFIFDLYFEDNVFYAVDRLNSNLVIMGRLMMSCLEYAMLLVCGKCSSLTK